MACWGVIERGCCLFCSVSMAMVGIIGFHGSMKQNTCELLKILDAGSWKDHYQGTGATFNLRNYVFVLLMWCALSLN